MGPWLELPLRQGWLLSLRAWVQISSVSAFCPGAELSLPGAGGGGIVGTLAGPPAVRWLPRAKMAASSAWRRVAAGLARAGSSLPLDPRSRLLLYIKLIVITAITFQDTVLV